MKRSSLFFSVVLLAVTCCLVYSFLVIPDDDDSAKDQFCHTFAIGAYDALLQEGLSPCSRRYIACEEPRFVDPFFSYLAQHEKSPPSFLS